MKVHTPVRLITKVRFVSPTRRKTPRRLAATIALGVAVVSGMVALASSRAADVTVDSDPAGVAQLTRPTIAVLGVGDLDEQGKAHTTTSGNNDAIIYSMTEAAITQSHAYHLIGRDQMNQQVREVKFDSEGWVKPETAQKFGKSQGIQNFITVFVSGGGSKRYTDAKANASTCPDNGNVVADKLTGEPAKSGGIANKSGDFLAGVVTANNLLNHKKGADVVNNYASGRYLMASTVDIMCRLTKVETSDRSTLTFQGHAIADGNRGDEASVAQAALKNAFDNLALYFRKNRSALVGNITDIWDGKAIVDLGEQDGVQADMGFEICEAKRVDTFVSYTHVCDARVSQLGPQKSLLEIGEFKKKMGHTSFHQQNDKVKQVHKGMVVREKT